MASVDIPEDNKGFAEKEKLNFSLLADPGKQMIKAYGVLGPSGFPNRVTFVIGPDGKIEKIYAKVKPAGHAAQVLEDL